MKNTLLILIVLSLLQTYNNDKVVKIKNFPEEQDLAGNVVKKDYVAGTSRVFILNDTVGLLFSLYNSQRCLYFVNLNTFDLINECGFIGKGSGELVNPGYIYIDKEENDIWLSDGMKNEIFKFPIDSALNINNYLPTSTIDFSKYGIVMHYAIEDNKIKLYNGQIGSSILNKVVDDIITGLGKSPLYIEDNLYENINKNVARFEKHPSKNIYAVAYYWDDVFLIMDENGEIIKRIEGPDFINPIKENPFFGYPVSAYQRICVDDNYIYCLYLGQPPGYREYDGPFVFNEAKEIFVYTWDGKPVKKLNLEYGAYSFDLDFKRNRILTYTNNLEEEIVYYEYKF